MWIYVVIAFGFPIWSTWFLIKNKGSLNDPEFLEKYGTLYQNLKKGDEKKKVETGVICWITIFLTKRLLIALITIFLMEFPWAQICMYQMVTMVQLAHLVDYMPMESKFQNYIEILNDGFVLLSSYSLFLFTDLVPDVAVRYSIGKYLMFILFGAVSLAFFIILCEIIRQVIEWNRMRKLKNI